MKLAGKKPPPLSMVLGTSWLAFTFLLSELSTGIKTLFPLCPPFIVNIRHDKYSADWFSVTAPLMVAKTRENNLMQKFEKFKLKVHSKCTIYREVFHLSVKSKLCLLWFCITMLSDWLRKLVPLSQPIRSKTKTNPESLVKVFPHLVLQVFEF